MIKLLITMSLLLASTSTFSKAKFDFKTFAKNHKITILSGSKKMGPIKLKTYNGKDFSSELVTGKVVLLNFFATWCPPCVAELPEFMNYEKKFGGSKFALIAVNAKETKRKVHKFMKRNKFSFNAFLDEKGEVLSQYSISNLPSTLIVDKKGVIRFRIEGGREWSSPEFIKFFQALMNE